MSFVIVQRVSRSDSLTAARSHLCRTIYDGQECQEFLKDDEAQNYVKNTKKLSEVQEKDFDAIFYVGGVSLMSRMQTFDTVDLLLIRFSNRRFVGCSTVLASIFA